MRRRIDSKEDAQKSLLDSLRDYMEAINGEEKETKEEAAA